MIRYAKVCPETNPGSRLRPQYHSKVLKSGLIELIEDEPLDLQEFYDSNAEQCDMAVIISKYLNGDVNALQRNKPLYGDFTKTPKTYAEWLQLRLDAEEQFYQLPIDVRARFGNSVDEFLATAGEDDWCEKLGLVKQADEVKEVSTDVDAQS